MLVVGDRVILVGNHLLVIIRLAGYQEGFSLLLFRCRTSLPYQEYEWHGYWD
jgi:hypothetical protein